MIRIRVKLSSEPYSRATVGLLMDIAHIAAPFAPLASHP